MKEPLRILGFCTLLAVVFGWMHDLVTASVSLEYFTVHHPPLPLPKNIFGMALGWGFLATFWVGAGLGGVISLAARIGEYPKLGLADLKPVLFRSMVGLYLSSMLVLGIAYLVLGNAARTYQGTGQEFQSSRRLMAVAITHSWSYLGAALLLVFLIAHVIKRRKREARSLGKG